MFYQFFWIIFTVNLQAWAQLRSYSQKVHTYGKVHAQEAIYGVDLPGFAIDFSEYFVSAVTLPSDSDEVYLTMMLLGHQTIYEDFPFESISTDEKTLSKWSQAIKIWKKEHDLHRSYKRKFFCVISSSSQGNSTYKSPVTWLEPIKRPIQSRTTNLNRNFEVIRCRMNPSTYLPTSESIWHVDIIEVDRKNRSMMFRELNYHTVVSFSLHPLPNRQVLYSGFPLLPFSSPTKQNSQKITLPSTKTRIYACIGSIRPYETPRPLIGIPSLLELIEHLLSLGISHIYMGLMMTWDSPIMKKYEYIFSSYLEANQLSFVSTSLPTYQDISGFDGIFLNDTYSDLFFYNYCLQQVQGKNNPPPSPSSSYLLFMKANQFLYLETEEVSSVSERFMEYLRGREQQQLDQKSNSIFTSFRHFHGEKKRHYHRGMEKESRTFTETRRLDTEPLKGKGSCSFSLSGSIYGITDNVEKSNPFGPSDFFFFQNYYQKSGSVVSLSHPAMEVLVVNPILTHAIDVLPSGKIVPLCSADAEVAVKSINTGISSLPQVRILTYDEDFIKFAANDRSSSESVLIQNYHDKLFQHIHQRLLKQGNHNHTTISYIQANLRQFQKQSLPLLQQKGKINSKIQDRRHIQLPFWQPCNTEHLSEIYLKIFS